MKGKVKKSKTALISVIFMLLITSILIISNTFNDYRLKTNLMAFQKREMVASVENFILIIDSVRSSIKAELERQNRSYTEEDVKKLLLPFIRHIVHESYFANDAYIWINEITDYDGGDNYAIRQVHGNLPETEGMLLSTSMQDAQGNLPYLEELNGIKENGEITYNYFFKEYRSDSVSEKITYAKLYKPYNWIVCTGTYLNSMYEPTGGVSESKKLAFYIVCFVLFLISVCLFAYMIISNHTNSRRLLIETEFLKDKVSRDSLTGAGSRAFGTKLLQEYLNSYLTEGINYSLAILDIDNFKTINDTYGHNIGDAVIKNMVNTIQEMQTAEDHIIRWGGDEFILTYKNNQENFASVMEALNKKIARQKVLTESGQEIQYSISIGASSFNEKDSNIGDAIKRIDDALYLAKREKNTYYIIS